MSFILPGTSGVLGKKLPVDVYANSNSVALDGSGDYITVTHDNSLSFGDASTDSPVSILVNLKFDSASTGAQRIVHKGYNASPEFLLTVTGGNKYSIQFYDQVATIFIGRTSVDNVVRGSWQQLLVTYDGGGLSSGIKMYLGGSAISTTDNSSIYSYTAMHNLAGNLEFGAITALSSYMFGLFADVCFYNKALSATEASAVWNGGTMIDPRIVDTSAVISYWGMEEGSGTSVADTGENNANTGTITNATWSTDVP